MAVLFRGQRLSKGQIWLMWPIQSAPSTHLYPLRDIKEWFQNPKDKRYTITIRHRQRPLMTNASTLLKLRIFMISNLSKWTSWRTSKSLWATTHGALRLKKHLRIIRSFVRQCRRGPCTTKDILCLIKHNMFTRILTSIQFSRTLHQST